MSAPTMAMPHMLVFSTPAMLQYRFSQLAALSPVQWAVHLPAPGKVDLSAHRAYTGSATVDFSMPCFALFCQSLGAYTASNAVLQSSWCGAHSKTHRSKTKK